MSEPTYNREDELLQRLGEGDERAFDYFFHRFYTLMVVFAKRFLIDVDAAEEVVQDVFYKVWERRGNFQDVQALKAFLYISTKNTTLNQLSKYQNREKYQQAYAMLNQQTDRPVIHEIIRAEVLTSLSNAIDTLPEQCRKIIRMIFEEDEKPADIAKKLNISISTVNNQKARGLSLLRERLTGKDLDLLLWVLSISYSVGEGIV